MTHILADRHHAGLTNSLILLFEKRLGYTLKFQKGLEWYTEGYWNVYPHIDTAKQYLEREVEGLKGITLEEFKNTEFDILIASLPQHIDPFRRLIELYQPNAKLIFQVGNQWDPHHFLVKNIMASAKLPPLTGLNTIEYHQEFDLNTFHYGQPKLSKNMYSFINCLNTADLFKKDWEFFLQLEKLMPDWNFRSYGGQCRDGYYNSTTEIADKMREAFFVFHLKSGGDGYGHNLWNTAFVGRPMITRLSDYQGKLGEVLFSDGETCLTIDDKDPYEISKLLNMIYEDYSIYEDMCQKIYKRATENCNFEKEAREIETFILNLI